MKTIDRVGEIINIYNKQKALISDVLKEKK